MENIERVFVGDEKGNLDTRELTEQEITLNDKYKLEEEKKDLRVFQEEISKTEKTLKMLNQAKKMCEMNIKSLEERLENK